MGAFYGKIRSTITAFGGFLVAQQAVRRMLPRIRDDKDQFEIVAVVRSDAKI